MEERVRLKALEALFDPTTTARIVALPAAGEVVIAVEASPVSQYDLMTISGNYGYRRHLPAIMGTEGIGGFVQIEPTARTSSASFVFIRTGLCITTTTKGLHL